MSATATELKAADKATAEEPKKSKKKLVIIIAVVVLLVGGYVAKGILLKTTYKPGQKVPEGKILPLDQVTVNLSDGRMVQASISLQLSVVATPAALSEDLTKFDDAAVTELGRGTAKTLMPAAGRDALKAEILKDCQKIAGTTDGAAQKVLDIYFTGFVIQ